MPRLPAGSALELHLARRARERYQLDELLFALEPGRDGGAEEILTDLGAVRRLAQAINAGRDLVAAPEQGLRAGQLHALGLLHEHLHRLLAGYRERVGADLFARALAWLHRRFGHAKVDAMLRAFVTLFPPVAVYRGEIGVEAYLAATRDVGDRTGVPNAEIVLEEALLLWLANDNPAIAGAAPLRELFDDAELEAAAGYREIVASLEDFFAEQPPADADGRSLVELLREPARRAPESLAEQLALVLDGTRPLPSAEAGRLRLGLDVIREEDRPPFPGPGAGPPPPPEVPSFDELADEEARFSQDRDWMPSLVLVAKNVLVWLDQLSRLHRRPIRRLDQIPDQALIQLRAWGFNGLWLIGLWRRSAASKRIKELTGNPEAAASAYAVDDYEIDDALGGEEALDALRRQAERLGIRLACDMVPNHMGIDSRWVLDHPERFLSLAEPPFPGYTFTGPDLSPDPRVAIHLEDHYYDRSDAAVVFRRREKRGGRTRYLYHGNDGTALPWNDTAQLDYLRAETRAAVLETILEVARRFSVIRFDAAMTLAKRHVRRLWHPPPGEAGGVPSRAERAVSERAFERAMPEEFWREVVERIAEEAPDTLLLAEAFWLMEGYFVRSLGMHRVYNSAFMHMLRDESNAELRAAIGEALAFDPAILQRYVNFLTTPDEAPAAEQFGTGDKYLAVATLMVTLPGLPMFGHGQVEGLREKYGMEYRRAYRAEASDPRAVATHERALAPLLRYRRLFARVDGFELLDLETGNGGGEVIEDVFAFVNRRGTTRALVVVHNAARFVDGRLRRTVPRRRADGEKRRARLLAALGLEAAPDVLVRCRDPIRGLEYLLVSTTLARHGLDIALGPYESRVLLDIEPLRDHADGRWRRLAVALGRRGVPSLEAALDDLLTQPLREPWRPLLEPALLARLIDVDTGGAETVTEAQSRLGRAVEAIRALRPPEPGRPRHDLGTTVTETLLPAAGAALHALRALRIARAEARAIRVAALRPGDGPAEIGDGLSAVGDESPFAARDREEDRQREARWAALAAWALLRRLDLIGSGNRGVDAGGETSRALIDAWRLGDLLREALTALGASAETARQETAAFALAVRWRRWYRHAPSGPAAALRALLADGEVRRFLNVNRFEGVVYYDRDAFAALGWWLLRLAEIGLHAGELVGTPGASEKARAAALDATLRVVLAWHEAAEPSAYRLETLLALLEAGIERGTDPALSSGQPRSGRHSPPNAPEPTKGA